MKYMRMMNTMSAEAPAWPQRDFQGHVAFMIRLNKELCASGGPVYAEGLSFPDQAKVVRAGKDGLPITGEVFPENKEFLAGFWIIDVDTPVSGYATALGISTTPGLDGKPPDMSIEVCPITGGPPPEML